MESVGGGWRRVKLGSRLRTLTCYLPPRAVCFQVMASAAVGTACVTPTGPATTATVPRAPTPACPATGCCAAAGASVSVAAACASSPAPTGTPVRSAPPALMPAPLRSEWAEKGVGVSWVLEGGRGSPRLEFPTLQVVSHSPKL